MGQGDPRYRVEDRVNRALARRALLVLRSGAWVPAQHGCRMNGAQKKRMPIRHAVFLPKDQAGEPWWTRLSGRCLADLLLFARFDQHQRRVIDHRCRTLDARRAWRFGVLG